VLGTVMSLSTYGTRTTKANEWEFLRMVKSSRWELFLAEDGRNEKSIARVGCITVEH
jgi:hypothetical protein